ncbi:MAG: hypothetical protein FJW36_02755 [Acidobacteria bacterium]|nr:hypothetical protein [Acidobacteriota bacterium]
MPALFLFLCFTLAAQPPDTFVPAAKMSVPCWAHSATLLQNGKVLIAGGDCTVALARSCQGTAEIYDPVTDTFTPTGKMLEGRNWHSATLLADGRVLIAGGFVNRDLNTAEIYDPSTGAFTATGKLSSPTCEHSAILLPDGNVFLAGGCGGMQSYDPEVGKFSQIFNAGLTSNFSRSVLLTNLKVLTTVGWLALNIIYDPGTQSLIFPENQSNYRIGEFSTVTLLANGHVLIAGGNQSAYDEVGMESLDVYDPAANRLWRAGSMPQPRVNHTATLLPDGDVLLAGWALGFWDDGSASGDIFNARESRVRTISATMLTPRARHTATLLRDGRVWIAGGSFTELSTEIYIPKSQIPVPQILTVDGGKFAAVTSASGRLRTVDSPAAPGDVVVASLESHAERSQIPPFVIVRGRPAEVLYFGKVPGYESLNQINFRIPAATLPGAAVSLSIRELGRPSNTVSIPVR